MHKTISDLLGAPETSLTRLTQTLSAWGTPDTSSQGFCKHSTRLVGHFWGVMDCVYTMSSMWNWKATHHNYYYYCEPCFSIYCFYIKNWKLFLASFLSIFFRFRQKQFGWKHEHHYLCQPNVLPLWMFWLLPRDYHSTELFTSRRNFLFAFTFLDPFHVLQTAD